MVPTLAELAAQVTCSSAASAAAADTHSRALAQELEAALAHRNARTV